MSHSTILALLFVTLKILSIPIWLPVIIVYIKRKYLG